MTKIRRMKISGIFRAAKYSLNADGFDAATPDVRVTAPLFRPASDFGSDDPNEVLESTY
jgi:hypothetical protein